MMSPGFRSCGLIGIFVRSLDPVKEGLDIDHVARAQVGNAGTNAANEIQQVLVERPRGPRVIGQGLAASAGGLARDGGNFQEENASAAGR